MLLNEKEFFEKILPEEMMIFIEEHFKEHADRWDRHYCKNIKIYTLEIGRELEEKLYNEHVLSDVWDFIIMDAIHNWKAENGTEIYQKGRCGGWLYLETAKVQDFSNYEPVRQEDENYNEYEDRMYPLRGLFEDLWKFEKWYQKTYNEVISYLKEVKIEEKEED